MLRFLLSGGIFILALGACQSVPSRGGLTSQNVRTVLSELNTPLQSYTWDRIDDLTGTAPTNKVERFALRDGHCRGSDCNAGRARVERHVVTDLKDGDRLRYSYSIYFPSNEYNVVQGVSTTVGQLFLSVRRGSFDGNPIWDLNTTERGRNWYMRMLTPIPGSEPFDTRTVRRFDMGVIPFDRWVRVTVDAQLSTGPDGYIEAFLDGRRVGQVTGPNIIPNALLEYDYGIYQKLLGLGEAGGVREGIPQQVVLYSGISFNRLPAGEQRQGTPNLPRS